MAAGMFIEGYVEACRKENAQLGKRRKQAQTALNRARAAKDRVVSLGVRGIIDLDATERQARPLMVEIAECEAILARTPDAPQVNYHPMAVASYRLIVERLAELLNDDHMENTRVQLRKLIEKVVIHPTLPFKPYDIEIQGLLVAINNNAPEGFEGIGNQVRFSCWACACYDACNRKLYSKLACYANAEIRSSDVQRGWKPS